MGWLARIDGLISSVCVQYYEVYRLLASGIENHIYAARGLLGPSPHRAFPVHRALNVTKAFLSHSQSFLRPTIRVVIERRRRIL